MLFTFCLILDIGSCMTEGKPVFPFEGIFVGNILVEDNASLFVSLNIIYSINFYNAVNYSFFWDVN